MIGLGVPHVARWISKIVERVNISSVLCKKKVFSGSIVTNDFSFKMYMSRATEV